MEIFYTKIYDEGGDSTVDREFKSKEQAFERKQELIEAGFEYIGVFKRTIQDSRGD